MTTTGTEAGDLRDSPYLTRLPQQRLALGVRAPGKARGMISMSFPAPFDCRDTCALELDRGLAVTLVATPSRGSRFLGWSGACKGRGARVTSLSAATERSARSSGRQRSACPSRLPEEAAYRARPPGSRVLDAARRRSRPAHTSRSVRPPSPGTGSPDGRGAAGERVAASSGSTAIGLQSRRSLGPREHRCGNRRTRLEGVPHADRWQGGPGSRDQLCLRFRRRKRLRGPRRRRARHERRPEDLPEVRLRGRGAGELRSAGGTADLPTTSTRGFRQSRSASSRHALYTRSCAGSSGLLCNRLQGLIATTAQL